MSEYHAVRLATTKDVAARAGVSTGTVSHALNKPHLVSVAIRRPELVARFHLSARFMIIRSSCY